MPRQFPDDRAGAEVALASLSVEDVTRSIERALAARQRLEQERRGTRTLRQPAPQVENGLD